jgi:hypothetical protein
MLYLIISRGGVLLRTAATLARARILEWGVLSCLAEVCRSLLFVLAPSSLSAADKNTMMDTIDTLLERWVPGGCDRGWGWDRDRDRDQVRLADKQGVFVYRAVHDILHVCGVRARAVLCGCGCKCACRCGCGCGCECGCGCGCECGHGCKCGFECECVCRYGCGRRPYASRFVRAVSSGMRRGERGLCGHYEQNWACERRERIALLMCVCV